MGLTIYFSGNFNPKASLADMIEEVKEIADKGKWKYCIYETEFPPKSSGKKEVNDKLYGILFSPPECEPVPLTFLSNGKMCHPLFFDIWLNSKSKRTALPALGCFTKTQYAGAKTHARIINLLRQLNPKYFSHFSVIDDGKFWDTNDLPKLIATFREWNALIDGFAEALKNLKPIKGENLENSILRAAKSVKVKPKNKKSNSRKSKNPG